MSTGLAAELLDEEGEEQHHHAVELQQSGMLVASGPNPSVLADVERGRVAHSLGVGTVGIAATGAVGPAREDGCRVGVRVRVGGGVGVGVGVRVRLGLGLGLGLGVCV